MPGLEIEYKAAKKAAKGFLDAESRAHDTLHVALAQAYEFYVAGRAKPAYMEELLSQAGLSPTNLSPASNQVVKLLFYPEKSAQSEKRQTISKWAIVLRECELAGVKPKDAKKHIAQHTIDGLVEENRQRQLSSGAPSTGKAMTKFEQGKQIATGFQSLGDFQHDGSYSDGLGLALIEIDGGIAKVRRLVADENSATTQKYTRSLAAKYPWNSTEFLPMGLLCKAARIGLRNGKSLAGIISNDANGCTVRIALSGTLKTGLARGFFPEIKALQKGVYYLDSKTLQILGRHLPKYRSNDWAVLTTKTGASINIDIPAGKITIDLPKYDSKKPLASLSSLAKDSTIRLELDEAFLKRLAEMEEPFKSAKARTVKHVVSDNTWEMSGLQGNSIQVPLPKSLEIGSAKVKIDLSDDAFMRIGRAVKTVATTYKEAKTSLLIGNGYLGLCICDLYGGQWELFIPEQKGGDYDPALMTYDDVNQEPLYKTS